MNIEQIQCALLWSFVIQYGILLLWFVILVLCPNWIYNFHTQWFPMSKKKFFRYHYLLMGIYKLLILTFNLIPFLAIKLAL